MTYKQTTINADCNSFDVFIEFRLDIRPHYPQQVEPQFAAGVGRV